MCFGFITHNPILKHLTVKRIAFDVGPVPNLCVFHGAGEGILTPIYQYI